MKCCVNCEWSISPELEDEIMKEQGYKDNDPMRPYAGDCSLGLKPDDNYCCQSHIYIARMEEYENEVYYEDQYFGIGYLITSKLNGEIVKFIKISTFGEGGFPQFSIRGFEKDSKDNLNNNFRNIYLTIKKGEPLYEIVSNLAMNLNGKKLYSIDSSTQGKNNLSATYDAGEASLIISKDIYNVKNATDYIDIFLGDNDLCNNYNALQAFYNELSNISLVNVEEDIKKLLYNY